ncbi:hypothetical protein JCM8547_002232 [Rhodosporidiobolus lusitaniae]
MSSVWPRCIRFVAQEDDKTYYGVPQEEGDLGLLYWNGQRITARVLSASPLSPHTTLSSRTLTVKQLLSPLAPSEVTAIRGLGLQYPVDSSKPVTKPDVPVLFLKPQSSLVGPGDEIFIPRLARGEKNDYEVELCVVIGRDCRNVKAEEAMDYVLGYTVADDVTSRGLGAKGLQWGMGKAFDTWQPIGPCLVSPSSLKKDPHDLSISTHLNGQLVQEGSTRNLVIQLPELISRLSHGANLQAGSIILTGSPLAIGRSAPGDLTDSSPFLSHCDEVRCFVEGIGTLVNTVREEGATAKPGHVKSKL